MRSQVVPDLDMGSTTKNVCWNYGEHDKPQGDVWYSGTEKRRVGSVLFHLGTSRHQA